MRHSFTKRDSAGKIIQSHKDEFESKVELCLKQGDLSKVCVYDLVDIANPPIDEAKVVQDRNSRPQNHTLCSHLEDSCLPMQKFSVQACNGAKGVNWRCTFCPHTASFRQQILTHFHAKHEPDILITCHFCDHQATLNELKIHQIQVHVLDVMETMEIPVRNQETPLIGISAFELHIRNCVNNPSGQQPAHLNMGHCLKHLQTRCPHRERIMFAFNLKQLCQKRILTPYWTIAGFFIRRWSDGGGNIAVTSIVIIVHWQWMFCASHFVLCTYLWIMFLCLSISKYLGLNRCEWLKIEFERDNCWSEPKTLSKSRISHGQWRTATAMVRQKNAKKKRETVKVRKSTTRNQSISTWLWFFRKNWCSRTIHD